MPSAALRAEAFAVGEVGSDLPPTLLMGFSRVPTTNSGELEVTEQEQTCTVDI